MFLIGLLLGYDHTIENVEETSKTKPKKQNDKQLNFSDDSFFNGDDFNTPFEEAIDFLKSKIPMTKTEWNELEKKLRFRAFTVGALSEADAIEKVKQALLDNLEKREPFYKAWEKFKDIAKSDGKDYFARYFETVYRTNIQSAYNAGRLMQYKNNQPPAWELLFMEDSRMSDICTNLMNEVGRQAIKSDDAFWSTVGFPPYHFNCRTTFRAVYPDELQTDKITLIEPQNPAPLANGFGGNPLDKESFWKLTDTMLERAEKYGLKTVIEKTANALGLNDFSFSGIKEDRKLAKVGSVQFYKNITEAKKTVEPMMAWRVDVHSEKEYTTITTFSTRKGSVVAIKPNGDIVSVCKNVRDEATHGVQLIEQAVKNGGIKLDSFSGNHNFYTRNGFYPVSYCEFNKEYAPVGWDEKRDRLEDVVFYVYTGEKKQTDWDIIKNSVKKFSGDDAYDEAMKYRDSFITGEMGKWQVKKISPIKNIVKQ